MSVRKNKFHDPEKFSPLEKMTWRGYYEVHGAFGIGGYVDATQNAIDAVQYLMTISNDFEELKKQLTGYVEDRQKFLKSAHPDKWAIDNKKNFQVYLNFIRKDALDL